VEATGFLMVGPKALSETDKEQSRLDIVDEQLDVTGRAFLGLTLACARCHDHKFDPISTADYYGLAGIFRSTEPFRDEVPTASFWQEWELYRRPNGQALVVMAPKEGRPMDLRVHLRGNRFTLGAVVPRHFPRVLAGEAPAAIAPGHSGRLELARWIASAQNPLTARVLVNRVWQYHFGSGLAATSDNFGLRGERPTHPKLLDWLAAQFVESGWSVKALHRLVMNTSTYRMSSTANPRALAVDPDNRLLAHMPRQRLDAESLRDALLAIGGRLDPAVGGGEAGEFLYKEAEVIDRRRDFFRPNQVKADHPYYTACARRSLYLPVVRNALPDVLALFDPANPNGVTAVRDDTTVPGQALFLLNHPFVREQALAFARRLLTGAAPDDVARVGAAYRLALGRAPRSDETARALEFLAHYAARAVAKRHDAGAARTTAWQSFCQALFCANEFLYVE
jgi:hypothetical protein